MQTGSAFLYWLVSYTLRAIFTLTCKVRIMGAGNLPRKGAIILASNHISHFDPPFYSAYMPRRIDWMAMEEMFQTAATAKFFRGVGCIPTNRHEGDRNALRNAVKRLKAGRCIGIFSEGGIRAGASSVLEGAAFREGTAALGLLAHTPIVPCVIIGSDRMYAPKSWWPLRRVTVCMGIGKPISGEAHRSRETLQRELAAAFLSIRDQLAVKYSLAPEDMPQTPQRRKGREP